MRREPFPYAGLPIKHFAAHEGPWWPRAKRVPPVERAGVSPQFGGELFLRQKFSKKRYYLGHGELLRVVTRTQAAPGEVYKKGE